MRVVVIGATGHIGGYLVPRLVSAGHDVVTVSRHGRPYYREHASWAQVTSVIVDREAEDAAGTFGERVADLEADTVVDLICFEPDSASQLVEALRPKGTYLVHCGTIWVHGPSTVVPTTEDAPRRPFGHYGEAKAAIEELLSEERREGGLPVAVLHPGHIVGPGWVPVNPAGNVELSVFERLMTGQEIALPNLGLETLHHVHADDVAQAFALAVERPEAASGESFHVTSERAITLRGYAEAVAEFYGQPSRLSLLAWDPWRDTVTEPAAQITWDHIAHSPCMSIDKARRLLGYNPTYTSLEAVWDSLAWLVANGRLSAGASQRSY
ncbi:MAG: NAD-dependent epimerase/dehydratase family protein [Acidimicrobiales bacterium]